MKSRTKFISVEVVIKTDCPHEAFVEWFAAQDNYVDVHSCETHRSYIYFAPLPNGKRPPPNSPPSTAKPPKPGGMTKPEGQYQNPAPWTSY